jgi:hypothetical protein
MKGSFTVLARKGRRLGPNSDKRETDAETEREIEQQQKKNKKKIRIKARK